VLTDPDSAFLTWLSFAVCLGVIGYAGVKLSKYGDVIADKTGLGGTWIGLVLLATVTSLPELITGISSVTLAAVPEIAAGDILGSCVFNLGIIVILDFLHRTESVYTRASQGHILTAGFGIMLIGFTGFNILLADNGSSMNLGHTGISSYVIILLYIVAMRTVFRYESRQIQAFTDKEPDRYPELSLNQAILRYGIAALLVVAAGAALPFVAKAIALRMAWHESFVGTLFVALVTSVPEMVVSIAALRLGALDMAIGNLFGSNLFNILILAVDDLLYSRGPLFAAISPTHAVSAFSAVMMTGVAVVGLLYRPQARVLKTVGWASIFLFSIYLINAYVLFLYGHDSIAP
jgi:cation:H+ antiporter